MTILLFSVAPTSSALGVGRGAEMVQEEDPWTSISVLDKYLNVAAWPPVTM